MSHKISIEQLVGAQRINNELREADNILELFYIDEQFGNDLCKKVLVKNPNTGYGTISGVDGLDLTDPNTWQDIIVGFRQNERAHLKSIEEE